MRFDNDEKFETMPAKKSWGEHGTVRRYRQGGCDDLIGGNPGEGDRCARCKLAQREFGQGQRAGIANPKHGNVLPLDKRRRSSRNGAKQAVSSIKSTDTEPNDPPKPPKAMGVNEKAVRNQLAEFEESQPVRFQMAITCAVILDDAERVTLHPPTLRQLDGIVEKLTGGRKTKSKGRLATVQRMTSKTKAN